MESVKERSFNKHPTVPRFYQGQEIEVDEEIAPFLDLLWKAGIETSFSCQGGPRIKNRCLGLLKGRILSDVTAYIAFKNRQEFLKFIYLLKNDWLQLTTYLSSISFGRGNLENHVGIYFSHKKLKDLMAFVETKFQKEN